MRYYYTCVCYCCFTLLILSVGLHIVNCVLCINYLRLTRALYKNHSLALYSTQFLKNLIDVRLCRASSLLISQKLINQTLVCVCVCVCVAWSCIMFASRHFSSETERTPVQLAAGTWVEQGFSREWVREREKESFEGDHSRFGIDTGYWFMSTNESLTPSSIDRRAQ